jgi:hypothetical protein
MRSQHFIFALFVVLGAIITAPAQAASPRLLLQQGDWKAYTLPNEEGKVCYVVAKPQRIEGGSKGRGITYFFINFRPRLEIKNEVLVEARFPYKQDSTVTVTVGENSFVFVTENTRAWQTGTGTDRALVNAMQRSKSMTVQSISAQNTRITETYSLRDFSDVYNAAAKDCGGS